MIDSLKSEDAITLLKKMKSVYYNTSSSWIGFYGLVYRFKQLKTDLGYNDLSLSDGSIIKKSKLVRALFDISESLYSRISSLCERYMDLSGEEFCLLDQYKDYDRTKLIELLQLTEEKLLDGIEEGFITPELTRRELRFIIKKLNGKIDEESKPTPEEEMEIPYVRTYREHWNKKDLQMLSKQELVSLYIDLQKKFEEIKSKKNCAGAKNI